MSEPIAGHYEGYRVFQVVGDRLCSFAAQYEYEPGLNTATCKQKHEKVPAKGCACGFWLYHTEWRARHQFEDILTPKALTRTAYGYGDFGDEAPEYVLGKVRGGGEAIVGRDGARLAQVEVVALVTDLPALFTKVLEHYGIESVAPAITTTAWLTKVEGCTVHLRHLSPKNKEASGLFVVDAGVEVPDPVAHVVAEFEWRGKVRYVTRLDVVPPTDEEDD